MRLIEPLLGCRLTRKDYLQINAFSDLVLIEREGIPCVLQKKAIEGAISEVVKRTSI